MWIVNEKSAQKQHWRQKPALGHLENSKYATELEWKEQELRPQGLPRPVVWGIMNQYKTFGFYFERESLEGSLQKKVTWFNFYFETFTMATVQKVVHVYGGRED